MKLSNKILIGFFAFIFFYLTAIFAEIRFSGTSNVLDEKNSVAEKVALSGIRHLVLNDVDREVRILRADSSRLEVRSLTGDMLARLKYVVSGDTLTLSGLKSERNERVNISVFISNTSLRQIMINRAAINLSGLKQDYLFILENAGRVWMRDNKISRIKVKASNQSFMNITGPDIDSLALGINESEVRVYPSVGFLQGSMENKATLQLNNVLEVQLKKDSTSRLSVY